LLMLASWIPELENLPWARCFAGVLVRRRRSELIMEDKRREGR